MNREKLSRPFTQLSIPLFPQQYHHDTFTGHQLIELFLTPHQVHLTIITCYFLGSVLFLKKYKKITQETMGCSYNDVDTDRQIDRRVGDMPQGFT